MYCIKCGNKISETASFCNKCGEPVKTTNSAKEVVPNTEVKTPLPNKKNKRNKILIGIIIGVIILAIAIACIILLPRFLKDDSPKLPTTKQTEEKHDSEPRTEESIEIANLAVGNIVKFGSYEQDGNFDNGKEPVEWDVIYEADDYFLLISHYILDATRYSLNVDAQNWDIDGSWGASNIRNFLNGYFYNEAFNSGEKLLIVPNTSNGTGDNVYLLKASELPLYFDVKESDSMSPTASAPIYFGSSIVCGTTQYILNAHNSKDSDEITATRDKLDIFDINNPGGRITELVENAKPEYRDCAAAWMLTPEGYKTHEDFAVYVSNNGYVTSWGASIYSTMGVRPVIAVKKNSVTTVSGETKVPDSSGGDTITSGSPSYGSESAEDYLINKYCTLQINLTRENTLGDQTLNGILGLADSLYGTDLVSGAQYDVVVFMDNELVDIIPYDEPMRDYTFLVEKGETHFLEIYNADDIDGNLGTAESYKIYEDQVFARQINTYSDGKMYLEALDPDSRYDYKEDIEFLKAAATVTIGTFTVLKIANDTGIIAGLKAANQRDREKIRENLSKLEKAYAEQREIDAKVKQELEESLAQQKKDDAWANFYYLYSRDPDEINIATQRAHSYAFSLEH